MFLSYDGPLKASELEDERTQKILTANLNDQSITEFIFKGSREHLINLSRVINVALSTGKYSYTEDSGTNVSVIIEK